MSGYVGEGAGAGAESIEQGQNQKAQLPAPCLNGGLQGRDANSATNMRHVLVEMLLGNPRPAALCPTGGGGGGAGPGGGGAAVVMVATAAAAATAAGPVAAAWAALSPVVAAAARMCGAEGAGKAMWRRTAQRRLRSGAGAQVEACQWCLVSDLC